MEQQWKEFLGRIQEAQQKFIRRNKKHRKGEDEATTEEVLGKLKGLKVDKLPRPDVLQPRVLKKTAEEIMEALVVIFQELPESGKVPEVWKMAN
eukprot:g47867.t1